MDKYIGKKLDGRYEIRELIGVGGMANVYKAYDVVEARTVAVKILREEYMNNDEFMRRFRNESRAISLLDHPNIVKVYDVIFSNRIQSIVMEYIDGHHPEGLHRPGKGAALEGSSPLYRADSAGAAARARQGHCPPRHQTAQYHAAVGRDHQNH